MKKFISYLILMCLAYIPARAQSADDKMFETLRGHASFHVVVAVLVIILLGILFTLYRIDKKVGRLEKEMNKK